MTQKAPRLRAATPARGSEKAVHFKEGGTIMPKKKRRRTWGSITTVTRGKHVLRWVENTPEGRKRRSRTFYGTYKEADAELARIRVKVGDDAPVPTIGQAYEMWWLPRAERRLAEGGLSANSFKLYGTAWRNIAAPRWSRTPVDSIRPAAVQEWLSGLSKGNAEKALTVLKQVVDFAVQYEVVPANKFRIHYDMPTKASRTRARGVYDLARARAVLEALRGSRIEPAYMLACFGSCRTGESLGARVDEMRFADVQGVPMAMVPIRRRMERQGCAPIESLKNEQSVRTVCIPGEYAERLREIAGERAAFGTPWLADRGDGTPMNVAVLDYEWKRLAGSDHIPFANLRNSWRTFAQAEWGVDYDVLETLMGHALPGVTGRHYLRMSDEQLAEQLARAYAAFLAR